METYMRLCAHLAAEMFRTKPVKKNGTYVYILCSRVLLCKYNGFRVQELFTSECIS
jgi:hypothetical protein